MVRWTKTSNRQSVLRIFSSTMTVLLAIVARSCDVSLEKWYCTGDTNLRYPRLFSDA